MQVLVFKTNIRYRKHISAIEPHITNHPGIAKWNVDLNDIDKILRIESNDLQPEKVVQLVNNAGYDCEELKD